MFDILAQTAVDVAAAPEAVEAVKETVSGKIHVAAAALAVPVGIGLIGLKACESVGRNPEASTKVLVQSIIAMAFAEAIIFFAIFLG